jgi:PAS domain S-box-containing protein
MGSAPAIHRVARGAWRMARGAPWQKRTSMQWYHISYIVALIIGVIGSIALAFYTFTRRSTPGATPLMVICSGVALWLIAYGFELNSPDMTRAFFWVSVQYIGIVTVPAAWLIFCIYYTNSHTWVNMRHALVVAIVPLTTLILAWTNGRHGLIWQRATLGTGDVFSMFMPVYGPWFWVHTAYSYLCVLLGILLVLRHLLHSPRIYQAQMVAVVSIVALPLFGSMLYVSGLSPWGRLDLTPVAFAFSAMILAWSFFRLHLLDIVPIARSSAVESMRDGVLVLDMQRRVIDANPAALSMLGVSATEIVGQPATFALRHWQADLQRYRDVLELNEQVQAVVSGQEFWYDLRIFPLRDDQRVHGRLVMWHDITRQKQAELALSNARDEAEAANRAKSAFLAHMSHELRTPLNAILGYCQLLQIPSYREDAERVVNGLQAIEAAGDHLLALIDNVLNLSKIEAGREALNLEHFDIAEVIGEVARVHMPLIEQRGNTLATQVDPQIGAMLADKLKVRQILFNLLGNAAKFTSRGHIGVNAQRDVSGPADWIVVEICDSGIGIAPEHMPHLFQAFHQADQSNTRMYGGTGLGLAISRSYCLLMGGEIAVQSDLGVGTTFTVRLPAEVKPPTPTPA